MNNVASINQRTLLFGLLFAVSALAIAIIAGGMDTVMPAAHDTFHELRHGIGIACH